MQNKKRAIYHSNDDVFVFFDLNYSNLDCQEMRLIEKM